MAKVELLIRVVVFTPETNPQSASREALIEHLSDEVMARLEGRPAEESTLVDVRICDE